MQQHSSPSAMSGMWREDIRSGTLLNWKVWCLWKVKFTCKLWLGITPWSLYTCVLKWSIVSHIFKNNTKYKDRKFYCPDENQNWSLQIFFSLSWQSSFHFDICNAGNLKEVSKSKHFIRYVPHLEKRQSFLICLITTWCDIIYDNYPIDINLSIVTL